MKITLKIKSKTNLKGAGVTRLLVMIQKINKCFLPIAVFYPCICSNKKDYLVTKKLFQFLKENKSFNDLFRVWFKKIAPSVLSAKKVLELKFK